MIDGRTNVILALARPGSIASGRIAEELSQPVRAHDAPSCVRLGNGSEFASWAIQRRTKVEEI